SGRAQDRLRADLQPAPAARRGQNRARQGEARRQSAAEASSSVR
ncbi:hypothetical protein, partial [Pantoea piersonii]